MLYSTFRGKEGRRHWTVVNHLKGQIQALDFDELTKKTQKSTIFLRIMFKVCLDGVALIVHLALLFSLPYICGGLFFVIIM